MAATRNAPFTEADSQNNSVLSQTCVNTGFSIKAGDLIIAVVRYSGTGATITVSDNLNAGNYVQAFSQSNLIGIVGLTLAVFYMVNSAAAAPSALTITATYSAQNAAYFSAVAYHDALLANPLDQAVSSAFLSLTANPSTSALAPTAPGDIVIGCFALLEADVTTLSAESAGFSTVLFDSLGTSDRGHCNTADEVLVGSPSVTYSPTLSTPTAGLIGLAAFKAAPIPFRDFGVGSSGPGVPAGNQASY